MPPPSPFRLDPLAAAFFAVVHGLACWGAFGPWTTPRVLAAIGVYLACGIGTTVGLHRLICHRSFACPRWVEYALVTLAMPTGQGSPLLWAATHRVHHAHSDLPGDVHTPRRSFWYAHIGWMMDQNSTVQAEWRRYCRDIAADPYYVWLLRFRLVPQAIAVALVAATLGPAAICPCLYLPMVLWMHATYSVNSLCHLPFLGSVAWPTGDLSRNFWLVGWLALGEGWHNHHHAFPRSARHGLAWWQFDLSWWVIRGLAAVGLAWNLHGPTGRVARCAPMRTALPEPA